MDRRVLAIGWAMLVCAVAGCAGPTTGGDAGPPVLHPRWESCAAAAPAAEAGQDALTMPRLTDDFRPVAAVICRTVPERRASGGEDLLAVEERAGDVTALLGALRLPDEEPTDGACTMDLPHVPFLVLLDEQGRWVRPGVPVDACGKPRQEFRTAVEQLATERVSSRVQAQLESDEAAAAGCSQTHADMVWVSGTHDLDGGTADLPSSDAAVRLCHYQVPEGERGGGKPAGTFVSGRTLTAAEWTAVRRELAAAGPATACTTPSSRFVLLHPPAGQIYVEADGCRRVLFETGTGPALRQGSPALTKLLR